MAVAVLVPGYGGRLRVVERWRMAVAVRTLSVHGGGRLIVSGDGGEAERLAALAPPGTDVVLESTARSTLENVERSLPHLVDAERLAIATDLFHRRRIVQYLRGLQPDLLARVVDPVYRWREGWWMDAAGSLYVLSLPLHRASRRLKYRSRRPGGRVDDKPAG